MMNLESVWNVDSLNKALQTMDVLEKENVQLECRFSPGLAHRAKTLYWIRTNRYGTDNVAIGPSPLQENYSVDSRIESGIYDLRIINASYNRDNGKFECRIKEAGLSFNELYSKSVELTVLLKPSTPSIQMSSPIATEGQQLNLTCSSIGGSPTPQITWFNEGGTQSLEAEIIKGNDKDDPTYSILSIIPRKSDDQTSYFCSVWNRALGQIQKLTNSIKLNVNYFPRIKVGPHNPYRIIKGGTAKLTCRVDSKPLVHKVRWMKRDQILTTAFDYDIGRANIQHSGSYMCLADNGLGRVVHEEIKVSVLFPPVITLPDSREMNRNEDIVVDCMVRANPSPIKIEWFKENDHNFHQPGNKLKIRALSPYDAGIYVCSATNHMDPSSIAPDKIVRISNGTMQIHIRHRPGNAIIMPRNPIGVVERSLTLRCEANPPGFPLPQYSWWKDEGNQNITSIFGGQEFTLHQVLLSHEGRYCCQSHNDLGDGSFSCVTLKVYEAPKMIARLQPKLIRKEGDLNFQISCGAIGKPKPVVRWFKDGKLIRDSESKVYQIYTSEQPVDAERGTNVYSVLKFVGPQRMSPANRLLPSDKGQFVCRFENEIDRVESSTELKIKHAPIMINQFNKIAADLADKIYIRCSVRAFPTPRIEWSFRQRLLRESAYEMNMHPVGPGKEDEYTGYLKVPDVSPGDYGDYSCTAINSMGSKRSNIKLQKKSQPDTPESPWIIDVGFNSVKLGWREGFNGGFNDTLFIVQYNKHDDLLLFRYQKCVSQNPCNITNLYQNTRYFFKVKAANLMGESNYSNEVMAITKTDVSRIPRPSKVHFEKSREILSFRSSDFALRLVAQIETEDSDGTWKHLKEFNLGPDHYGNVVLQNYESIRVRFCLFSNPLICGPYEEALVVDDAATTTTSAEEGPNESWIIFISFIFLVLLIGMVIVVLKCYYFISGRTSFKSQNHNHHTPSAYTMSSSSFGLENKGIAGESSKEENEENASSFYDEKKNNLMNSEGSSLDPSSSLWNLKSSFYHQKKEMNCSLNNEDRPPTRYSTINRVNNASYFPYGDEHDVFGKRERRGGVLVGGTGGTDLINHSIDKRKCSTMPRKPPNLKIPPIRPDHQPSSSSNSSGIETETLAVMASKTRRIIREIIV
nr:hemicentin-1-like [Lepeophtheirus salmonis]